MSYLRRRSMIGKRPDPYLFENTHRAVLESNSERIYQENIPSIYPYDGVTYEKLTIELVIIPPTNMDGVICVIFDFGGNSPFRIAITRNSGVNKISTQIRDDDGDIASYIGGDAPNNSRYHIVTTIRNYSSIISSSDVQHWINGGNQSMSSSEVGTFEGLPAPIGQIDQRVYGADSNLKYEYLRVYKGVEFSNSEVADMYNSGSFPISSKSPTLNPYFSNIVLEKNFNQTPQAIIGEGTGVEQGTISYEAI